MADSKNPNQMIVEGVDDLQAVKGLMRAHVDWPDDDVNKAPVFIHRGGGAADILRPEQLGLYIKSPVIKKFGIMLDADTKADGRYRTIRKICEEEFPTLPDSLSPEGIVVENDARNRLGVWIMPNNESVGALEDFLQFLVPQDSSAQWDHAQRAVAVARNLGCKCRNSHLQKAALYTWLAWQDPPGQSVGAALTKRILDPMNPSATIFVDWFRKLYELPPRSKLFS